MFDSILFSISCILLSSPLIPDHFYHPQKGVAVCVFSDASGNTHICELLRILHQWPLRTAVVAAGGHLSWSSLTDQRCPVVVLPDFSELCRSGISRKGFGPSYPEVTLRWLSKAESILWEAVLQGDSFNVQDWGWDRTLYLRPLHVLWRCERAVAPFFFFFSSIFIYTVSPHRIYITPKGKSEQVHRFCPQTCH